MKVTKAQAQENRAHIVATASALFRERGYDGVGIADLMAAAGFTHGGFYKHFRSKADLMAEAAATTISRAVADSTGSDLAEFFKSYVSRAHRDARGVGCTMAALCGDAARQSESVKSTFAAGIDSLATTLEREVATLGDVDQREARAKVIGSFAQAVGAVVLSRACPDDSALADEILEVCRREILASLLPPMHSRQATAT
ncbi:TetR family transcriptional regulator [Aquabacterium sp.]|uniref:TetR family transcriptional regulator n=1 Tax=Aquabacterium sp. TaxID=1872578 RepID=UPI002C59579F|nr:TetR family transcriptional regulator [Aquabacterium sp.]HSW06062.1 TetR family transcriptional regulator [Aquabacterium sp.]